jgi:hypothetical protein
MTQHHYSREKSKADQVVGFSYIDVNDSIVKGLGDGVADDNVTKVDIPSNATGAILYVEISSGELRVSDNGGVPSSTSKRGRPVTKTGTMIYLGVSSTYKGSIAGLDNCKMICSAGATARVQVTYVRNVDR